jgi:hypothetical protein
MRIARLAERTLLLLCMPAVAAACAGRLHPASNTEATLWVRNTGVAMVTLHQIIGIGAAGDTLGYRLGTVYAGKTACFRLEAGPSSQWLLVHSAEGTFATVTFVPASRPAWRLDLTGHPETDRLSLQPADGKCR